MLHVLQFSIDWKVGRGGGVVVVVEDIFRVRVSNCMQDTGRDLRRERKLDQVHDLYRAYNWKLTLYITCHMTLFYRFYRRSYNAMKTWKMKKKLRLRRYVIYQYPLKSNDIWSQTISPQWNLMLIQLKKNLDLCASSFQSVFFFLILWRIFISAKMFKAYRHGNLPGGGVL